MSINCQHHWSVVSRTDQIFVNSCIRCRAMKPVGDGQFAIACPECGSRTEPRISKPLFPNTFECNCGIWMRVSADGASAIRVLRESNVPAFPDAPHFITPSAGATIERAVSEALRHAQTHHVNVQFSYGHITVHVREDSDPAFLVREYRAQEARTRDLAEQHQQRLLSEEQAEAQRRREADARLRSASPLAHRSAPPPKRHSWMQLPSRQLVCTKCALVIDPGERDDVGSCTLTHQPRLHKPKKQKPTPVIASSSTRRIRALPEE